jgi:hypothetical protein
VARMCVVSACFFCLFLSLNLTGHFSSVLTTRPALPSQVPAYLPSFPPVHNCCAPPANPHHRPPNRPPAHRPKSLSGGGCSSRTRSAPQAAL